MKCLEITNPSGLYGRMSINELGKIHPETRNPILTNMLEILHITENRYSGVPTIYRELKKMAYQLLFLYHNRVNSKLLLKIVCIKKICLLKIKF